MADWEVCNETIVLSSAALYFFVDVFLSQMCNSYIKCIHTTFTLMERLDSSTAEQRATDDNQDGYFCGFFLKEIAILR